MSDRPTLPPAANGGDDDLEADPLLNAPAWARSLFKSIELLSQHVADLVQREGALKGMMQRVIDNQTEVLTHQAQTDARLDDHESRIKALEKKQGGVSGIQKLDG